MRSLLVFDEVEEEWQETVVCGIAKVLERLAPVGLYEFELLCPLPYFLSFFFLVQRRLTRETCWWRVLDLIKQVGLPRRSSSGHSFRASGLALPILAETGNAAARAPTRFPRAPRPSEPRTPALGAHLADPERRADGARG